MDTSLPRAPPPPPPPPPTKGGWGICTLKYRPPPPPPPPPPSPHTPGAQPRACARIRSHVVYLCIVNAVKSQ